MNPGLPRKKLQLFVIEGTENPGASRTCLENTVSFIACSSLKYPIIQYMFIIKVFIIFEPFCSILNLLQQQQDFDFVKELYCESHGETEAHGSVGMKNSIAKPFTCFLSKCNQNSSSKMGRKTQGHTENHSEIVTQHTLQVATCLGTVSPCPLLLSVFQKSPLLLLTGR